MFTASYAGEKPISMTWEGTVTDTAINVVVPPADPPIPDLPANFIDAQVKGSFGPASLGVLSEFVVVGQEGTVLHLVFAYSKPIITFKNGDQLWGDIPGGNGYMFLDTATGEYYGSAEGVYTGGTGRFEGAGGPFVVDFAGTNLALPTLGVTFGTIYGEIEGTVILP
jgi:hypothetical protein